MKYERFVIENYRAIEKVELRLDSNLIPIIGLNESGKTTIFNALVAFDRSNDENFPNVVSSTNFYLDKEEGVVKAYISLEENVARHVSNIDSASLRDWFKAWSRERHSPQKNGYVELSRDLKSVTYTVRFVFVANDQTREVEHKSDIAPGEKIINYLTSHLPAINYFENFVFHIPEEIRFRRVISETKGGQTVSQSDIWSRTIERLFLSSGYNLSEFMSKSENEHFSKYLGHLNHREILEDVQVHLNDAIVSTWMLLFGEKFDEKPIYDMRLYYDRSLLPHDVEGEQSFIYSFSIRLRDSRDQARASAFSLNDRSKGFLWFANFVLMIVTSPQKSTSKVGNIFLLDEPGAYLHSAAQEQLLDLLVKVSENVTILYATHLAQLLDPKKVKPSHIRVTHRDDWKIQLAKYGHMSTDEKIGPMTALYEALQLKMSAFIHPNPTKPFVITEGIVDFYAYSMVVEFTSIFDNLDFDLIPGSGAPNLNTLISLAIAWSDPYVVIFDKDNAGNRAIEDYEKSFGEEQRQRYWIQLENVKGDRNVAVERLFSDGDRDRIEDLTNAKVKKAISILYFMDETVKKTYWDGIDTETTQSFKLLQKKLKAILNPTP